MPVIISHHVDPWLYASIVLFFVLQLVCCFACRRTVLRLCPSIVLGGILASALVLGLLLGGEAEWIALIVAIALPLLAPAPLLAWGIFGITVWIRSHTRRKAEAQK